MATEELVCSGCLSKNVQTKTEEILCQDGAIETMTLWLCMDCSRIHAFVSPGKHKIGYTLTSLIFKGSQVAFDDVVFSEIIAT